MAGEVAAEEKRAMWPVLLLILSLALLFTSFEWNVFHIETQQRSEDLGVDVYILPAMHMYVTGPKLQAALGEIFLFTDDPARPEPYIMQVGLHRMIFSWLSPRTDAGIDRATPYLRAMITLALALTMVGFLYFVMVEFGLFCAGMTAVLFALSDWLIVFAPDLFWVSATFFMPFVVACLLGDPQRRRSERRILAILFTFFCLIKCLCGYDYITNVFAAVAIPFLYYGLRRGMPLRMIALRIIGYGALSVIAFGCALALQLLQFVVIEKNAGSGISEFFQEIHRRTRINGEGISTRYADSVLSVLHRLHVSSQHDAAVSHFLLQLGPLLRYFRYLSMAAFTVPLPFHSLPVPIGLLIVGFLIAFLVYRKRNTLAMNEGTSKVAALMWSTLLALFVSHIWAVAANGHMRHTFFNAIIFYIPFLPMVFVLMSIAVQRYVLGHKIYDIA